MKPNVLVKTDDLSHEEWLQWRNKGIGGSDIAIILGLSRYKSKISLYLEKTGEKDPDDLSENEFIYWGNVLEDVVAKEFAKRTGQRVKKRNAMLQNPDYPFALANVDRLLIGKREGLECKTAGEYKKKEWSTDEIPDEYFIQCQWYMAVTGYERWHIAVLVGGNKFFHYPVERDEALIEMMLSEAEHFWNENVMKKQPPEWDGSDDAKNLLSELYPIAEKDEILELPETYEEKVERLDQVRDQIKMLDEEKSKIENEIKAMLKDREKAFIGDRLVSWTNIQSNRFDTKTFKKDFPDLYVKYAIPKASRRFQIS